MATRIGTLVDDKSGDTLYPITTVDAVAGSVKNVTVGGTSVVNGGVAEIPTIPELEALSYNEIDAIIEEVE